MSGRIYLLNDNSVITPMTESAYESEDLLQSLLSDHPDLLAGEQINPDEPRRWQLVTREMGVPGEEDGSNRWSLDHLFLDQDGVPTLVEVKRSSDSRIRREVVGQMLDYAANAVAYWPLEGIRAKFEARCEAQGTEPDDVIDEFAGPDHDPDDFWLRVKTNLQAGRVRLVFVADNIPAELRRVVEFLNTQMDPAEVLAVEVRQFVGEGAKTLVPRVFGQTELAQRKKGATARDKREKITAERFLADVDSAHGEPERSRIRKLLQLAQDLGLEQNFFLGKKHASFIPILRTRGLAVNPFSIWETGTMSETQYASLAPS